MSVSLTLLPVALAMRVVMGKENFENWVRAQQDRLVTDITGEAELGQILKTAGYDAIKYGSSIKTHIDGEKVFMFWDYVDGKWVAVFSKYLDEGVKDAFVERIEAAAQKPVFLRADGESQDSQQTFPTNFVDGDMLRQALSDLGGELKTNSDGSIVCRVDSAILVFTKNGDNPYDVSVRGASDIENAYQFVSDVDEAYCQSVQTSVYQRVKSEAEERNWLVDSEEVLPDKSILLTVKVG